MFGDSEERGLTMAIVAAPLRRGARPAMHGDTAPWLHRRIACAAIYSVAIVLLLSLTSCQTAGLRHLFAPLTPNWEARIGQLKYRGPKTTLIGEVLVRFSKSGDFELTFTKGPGVTLLIIHQDAKFARVEGPLARGRWAGPIEKSPRRLRGWLALRNVLEHGQKPMVKYSNGIEIFVFEF